MKHPAGVPRILRLLFWESTAKCNLSCAHCRRIDCDESAAADLDTATAKVLIGQLADLGGRQGFMPVMVFSGGEPLCRPDIYELIEYAAAHKLPPALATNATLIDASVAARLRAAGVVRVAASIDGASSATHDSLRRLSGSFDAAMAGISHLRNAEIPFQVNVTLTRRNASELHQVYDLAREIGAVALHVFMLVPVGCGRELADSDMLAPADYEKKLVEIAAFENGPLQVKVTCGPHYERVRRQLNVSAGTSAHAPGAAPGGHPSKGCLAGLGVIFVSHDGKVFPCGYLPVDCGNVLRQPLGDIWNDSPDLARMRDTSLLEGKCGICSFKRVCGGCRGRAFAATGNYMAEEPYCDYIPPEPPND